jgi:hypothetical protein
LTGHVFVAPGDLTQLSADAVAYSASNMLSRNGSLVSAFEAHVPGFRDFLWTRRPSFAKPLDVGTALWMPLPGGRRPFGVVVVVSTGRDAAPDEAAERAVRSALTEAVRQLRAAGHAGRLLVALPTFRVGLGGDRRRRLRSARTQVAAAVEALRGLADVDAAFIAYTPTLYYIYLEARRQVVGPAPGPRHPELEEALRAGEGVLFVGAGLSRGAGLPDWSQLIARLAADLGLPPGERFDYLDLAQWHLDRFGKKALGAVVRDTYAGAAALPTLAHYLLLGLPLRYVITTNYDDLLERALTALKRHPTTVVHQPDVAGVGRGDGPFVVKLHGDARHADEIVLCRDDYDAFFANRPAMALLLEGLLLTQTFFFAGYGLRDPNFRQVWARLARMLSQARRPAFATTFEGAGQAGTYLAEQWRRQGLHLIEIDGATADEQQARLLRFLDALAERVALDRPALFLAPDVEASPRLRRLRQLLADEVGEELCRRARADSEADLRQLAAVLDFLTRLGWRPALSGPVDLCGLWCWLAEQSATPADRRRWLTAALGCAEQYADAEAVRARLAELDGETEA